MKYTAIASRTLLCALLISGGACAAAYSSEAPVKEQIGGTITCGMKFNLQGMPAFSGTAKGEGLIMCDNGQIARLSIRATGGGMTFGRSEVVDGTGRFTDARTIDELFGSYVQAEVHAVAGDSAAVQVLTKGRISLVLAGTGRGVDFGFAFERFTIERANESALPSH